MSEKWVTIQSDNNGKEINVENPFRSTTRHPIERASEWTIRIVASFSILLIFLIFLFVFRETLTLFASGSDSSGSASSPAQTDPTQFAPDSYVPDSYLADEVLADSAAGTTDTRTFTGIYTPKNPYYPEIYNAETGMFPADVDAVPNAVTTLPAFGNAIPLWENLTTDIWQPVGEQPKFGLIPLLFGTAKTTFISILLGAPLGILAAIFTAFFAPRRLREIVKPAIELLAGFPSVVIGFFCLATVASFVQDTIDSEFRLNTLIGGIGLSLAVIPIVFSIAEDSLSAVPKSLREASLALGSSEWQTAYRVMLPAAAPGVFAAVLLGVGRAFGETMIAIMATGNAPLSDWSPLRPSRTFAATIGSEMGEVVWGSEHYGVLFLLGTILFIVSFGLNAVTELYVKKKLIKRFQGK